MKYRRAPILLLPLIVGLLSVIMLSDALHAAKSSVTGEGGQLVVVADTTESMQPELDALAAAWPGSVVADDAQDRPFHLVQYKDAVRYEGNTNSVAQFQNWLDALKAAGGHECEDAMLQALGMVARGAPNSRALVLSDSAPMGDRSNLAFIMNKLIEREVMIFPVISGWCNDSEFTQAAMFSLARMTGGVAHIHEAGETETAVRSTLDLMPLEDSILVENGNVDGIQVFPFEVDSTATTLGVDNKPCKPVWCLTCTLSIQTTTKLVESTEDIKLMVKSPDGKLLDASDPGVEVLETSGGTSFIIDVAKVFTPTGGQTSATWEVLVTGSGDHVLNAVAESALHLDYLGKHILTTNQSKLIRASLATETGAPEIDSASVKFAMKNAANGRVIPIDLFDDGQHGDGQVGDGIFGGLVTVRRGLWYLAARGKLADGGAFERMHEVPIRVKGFQAKKPGDRQQTPGSSHVLQFTVSNDEDNALNRITTRVYELSFDSLLGWATAEDFPSRLALAPGETKIIDVLVTVPKDAKLGDVEETYLTVMEEADFGASETLTVNTEVVEKMTVYLPATIRP